MLAGRAALCRTIWQTTHVDPSDGAGGGVAWDAGEIAASCDVRTNGYPWLCNSAAKTRFNCAAKSSQMAAICNLRLTVQDVLFRRLTR